MNPILSRRFFLLLLAFALGGFALRAAKIGEPLPEGPGQEWPRAGGQPGKIVLRLEDNKWRIYFLDHSGKIVAPPLPSATLYTDENQSGGRKNVIYTFALAQDGLALTSPLLVKPGIKTFYARMIVTDAKNPGKTESYPRTLVSPR